MAAEDFNCSALRKMRVTLLPIATPRDFTKTAQENKFRLQFISTVINFLQRYGDYFHLQTPLK